jgi:Lrp/AsnC family leucine-responsive transcriptional regulator
MHSPRKMLQLDQLDRKILTELQRDSTLTMERLAERIGLSLSAAHRRAQRLKACGIIQGCIAVVDSASVGRPALFIVGVEVERERPEQVKKLREWVESNPVVQQAYYVTGSADYMLVISVRDIDSFTAFISEMTAANPNVRRFTTNVVMSTVKRSLFVPVDES